MTVQQPTTLADDLREAHEAIEKLVDLYFDRVPLNEFDREQLAECIYEGLSDELDRLLRIDRKQATLRDLADRWERMAPKPPIGDLLVDEVTPAEAHKVARDHTYRQAAADVRDVLRTGLPPHGLMTDAELEQHGSPEVTS